MKYKQFVYTQVILIVTTIKFTSASGEPTENGGILSNFNRESNLERIITIWNKSSENSFQNRRAFSGEEDDEREKEGETERSNSVPNFPMEVSKCLEERQYEITEDFSRGRNIILNCFKTSLMLSIWGRYLGDSSQSSIKLFNGLLELKKIPGNTTEECNDETCENKYDRLFRRKKDEYTRLYRKAMQKLIDERKRFNSHRNITEEERTSQLNRINENSEAFLTEVIRNLGNEDAEKIEEEKLKKEMKDPRLLSVLDALSRKYMLKLKFYPGVAARMMRSNSGGFTFDLEIQDSGEEVEQETSSDESSTREIKDGPKGKDYFDDDDDDGDRKKKSKKGKKKKKKEMKKKAKKLKKIIPYLLLPMLIQMTLLPFVFKKLFFLAMKALFAGKVALILVGINLLRNTCIQKDDDYDKKIRVEHYGYRKGEEYGAWINGRSLEEPSLMTALSEEPFRGQKPVSA